MLVSRPNRVHIPWSLADDATSVTNSPGLGTLHATDIPDRIVNCRALSDALCLRLRNDAEAGEVQYCCPSWNFQN